MARLPRTLCRRVGRSSAFARGPARTVGRFPLRRQRSAQVCVPRERRRALEDRREASEWQGQGHAAGAAAGMRFTRHAIALIV